jgi:1-acyl-sn-glycerol-3-phosphate acyltransferase
MKFLSEYVKGGNLLALFPEGHIRRDGVVDNFKGGALLIAYLSDKPIIPMYHLRRKSIWNMTRIVIGKPFNVKEKIGPVLSQDKLNAVAEELRQYELHLQQLCEEEMKK